MKRTPNVRVLGREADPAKRLREAWGAAIRDQRTFLRLSLDEVAEAMEADGTPVTAAAIGMWERGETAPRWHNQFAVARVLQTTHARLFGSAEAA